MKSRTAFLCALTLCSLAAYAGEGGVSQYQPGSYDLDAGIQPPPGFYFESRFDYQSSSLLAPVMREGKLATNLNLDLYTESLDFLHVTNFRILGSHWAWGFRTPFTFMQIAEDFPGAIIDHRTDSSGNLGDIQVMPLMLGWDFGSHHLTSNFWFYTPSGKYETNQIANVGKNRWAIEEDVGYTYLSDSGQEGSLTFGWTMPFKNGQTDYTSGQELHADFALGEHLNSGLVPGLAGYWLRQITSDVGSGAKLGANEQQAFALGPIISWYTRSQNPLQLSLKYYWDISTNNRVSAQTFWFNLGIRL